MSNSITVYGNTGDPTITATYSQPSGGGIYGPGQIPGSGNGSGGTGGGPGGIGSGDGGFDTPSNNLLGKPAITFPSPGDNTDIEESDTVTATAFDDGGTGLTHVASRWMILLLNEDGDSTQANSPVYLFDSGVDTANLDTLPLTVVELQHDTHYAIRVRYKADDGTWSRWSDDQDFWSYGCPVPATLVSWLEFDVSNGYTLSGTDVTQLHDFSANSFVYNYLFSSDYAQVDTTTFAVDSLIFPAEISRYRAAVTAYYSLAQTIFIVGQVGDIQDVDAFLGVAGDLNIFSYGLGSMNYVGVLTGAGDSGSVVVSSTASGVSPGWQSPVNTLAAGDKFILEIYCQPAIDGNSLVVLNGATLYDAAESWGIVTGGDIGGYVDGVSAASTAGNLCEVRVYAANLTASQRESIRIQLAAKWGITF